MFLCVAAAASSTYSTIVIFILFKMHCRLQNPQLPIIIDV